MTAPILNTKLFKPAAGPQTIIRKRLNDRLNAGLKSKVILISAPAGFGKTTLISTWIDQLNSNVGWVSLDIADNDPNRFLTYCLASLQTADNELGKTTMSLLQSPQSSSVELIITNLINDITSTLNETILVLDDFHLIDSKEIHAAMDYLIENLPSNLKLVVLSRQDPPWHLSRMRVRNHLTELREADLRFTSEEALDFFRDTMKLELSQEDIAALDSRTEGWIASLQLAALAMQNRKDISAFIADFTGSHNYIVDYLTEEVLQHQSGEIQEFLLKTSILNRFCSGLCDAVTGKNNSSELLEYLIKSKLFVIPLSDTRIWYRYHHLFSDLLQYRLSLTYPDKIKDLHIRASIWYEENGLIEEAFFHAVKGDDFESAADLVESVSVNTLMRGEIVTLRKWVSQIPEEVVNKRALISICKAWIYNISGDLQKVEPEVLKAEKAIGEGQRRYNESDVANIKGHVVLLRSYYFSPFYTGNPENIIKHRQMLHEAEKNLQTTNPIILSILQLVIGGTYFFTCEWKPALEAFKSAQYYGELSGNHLVTYAAINNYADILIFQGKLKEAHRLISSAIDEAVSKYGKLFPPLSFSYLAMGKLMYEMNDIAAAEEYFQLCIKLTNTIANPAIYLMSLLQLAYIKQVQGNTKEAKAYLNKSESVGQINTIYLREITVESFRTRVLLLQKNFKSTISWIERFRKDPMTNAGLFSQAKLIIARTYIALGDNDTALLLLSELKDSSENFGATGWLIEALILESIAFDAEGETDRAIDSLKKSLALAESENYMRMYIDHGKSMTELLETVLAIYPDDESFSAGYVTLLINEMNKENSSNGLSDQEPLSDREIEVLRLLSAGFSNKAIAEKLFVAIGTIKKHTHSIYQKLDVDSRTKAIKKARDLNII
ncbi:MAG: AAA family ATPase [Ignavibacteriales bacterium]|nr:MAG: AAA family ATPase [Ignavibacteriales bacterium]